MTEQQAISTVVQTANEQVGTREGANNWNPYAAALDPLGITYGNKQNLAWCGEFVLWVFVHLFGADRALEMLCSPKPSGIPLCSLAAQYFKTAGRWTTQPQAGAVIFFFVNGGINHTGIVTAVNGNTITTVEGNSSDMVARRAYAIGDARIAGYGRPDWSVVAEQDETSAAENPAEEIPVVDEAATPGDGFKLEYHILRIGAGMTGQEQLREEVRAVQQRLRWMGFDIGPDGADGEFGENTAAAVRQYQRSVGLQADGEFGPLTRGRMDGLSI